MEKVNVAPSAHVCLKLAHSYVPIQLAKSLVSSSDASSAKQPVESSASQSEAAFEKHTLKGSQTRMLSTPLTYKLSVFVSTFTLQVPEAV